VKRLDVFTDGACDNVHSKVGGWAWVMIFRDQVISKSGRAKDTTNNKMELEAIIQAIETFNKGQLRVDQIIIHTDSEYSIGMLSGKWKVKRKTKNIPFIHRFFIARARAKELGTVIHFNKVKAHSGIKWNEVADRLAEGEI